MSDFFSEIMAVANSRRFTAFADGVSLRLADGRELFVKLASLDRSIRSVGHRFSKYAYVANVTAGEYSGVGYGEASTKMLALQKSISEGVERAVFYAVKGTSLGTSNSNGWAAHISSKKAFANGFDELLERDSILVHWLRQEAYLEIDKDSWPVSIRLWSQKELALAKNFNNFRILISNNGYVPTVTTVLSNTDGYAVLSHASGASLEHSLDRALAETCRIAEIALVTPAGTSDGNPKGPEEQAMYYAFHDRLPTWMFGDKIPWQMAAKEWRLRRRKFQPQALSPKFHSIAKGPLAVGYVSCDALQGLYFDDVHEAEKRGLINFSRLGKVGQLRGLNPLPHCVP